MADRTGKSERPRRRWLSRFILLLALLALLGWFSPILVARVPYLRNKVLAWADSKINGEISIETISLDWLSPVRLYNVEIVDAESLPVLAVDEVHTDKTLFQLIREQTNLGRISFERPQLNVIKSGDQVNLQQVLEPLLVEDDESTTSALTFDIVVTEGELKFTDEANASALDLSQLELEAEIETGDAVKVKAKATSLLGGFNKTGELAVQVSAEFGEVSEGELKIDVADLELAAVNSLGHLLAEDVEANGLINGQATGRWKGSEYAIDFSPVSLRGLHVLAPRWLGADQIRADRCSLSGRLSSSPAGVRCENVHLAMDESHLSLTGSVQLRALGGSWESTIDAMKSDDFEVTADMDLATLTTMFAETLNLQETARIEGGKATFKLISRAASKAEDHTWIAALETSDVRGTANGRPIVWRQPMQVDARVRKAGSLWILENANIRSEFMTLSGSGDARQGDVQVDGDLDQLFRQLSQFIDVRNIRMAGRVAGGAKWNRLEGSTVSADASLTLDDFQLAAPGIRPMVEPRLELTAKAIGKLQGDRLSLDDARLSITAGDDQFLAELREPVPEATLAARWPLTIRLLGELSNWMPRVQTFVPAGLDLKGAADLKADATIAPEGVELVSSEGRVEKFQLRGGGLFVDEPILVVKAAGRWDHRLQRWTSENTIVQSSALAFAAQNVRFGFAAPRVLSGSLSLRGDLARISAWTNTAENPASQRLEGTFTGTAHFDQQGDECRFDWTSEHLDVAVLGKPARRGPGGLVSAPRGGWKPVWKEPQLELSGKGRLTLTDGRLQLDEIHCTSDWLDVKASGSVEPASSQRRVDVQGEVAYDWDQVMRRMSPILGPGLTVSGRERRVFAIRGPLLSPASTAGVGPGRAAGPLAPSELQASAGLGWNTAHFQGFDIGRAAIEARLANSVIGFSPWDVEVSGGKLAMKPAIDLSSSTAVLTVADRASLDRVQISPEMCQTWLKYIAPLLADATRAKGEFSLVANKTRVPLTRVRRMTSQGALFIHQADVGPGSLASPILAVSQQVLAVVDRKNANRLAATDTWLQVPEQQIDYHVADGRVHHRGLEIRAKDVVIRTSGSVGFDESLALVAEIPVQDRWVERERLLSGLKGKSLKFQITGTLSKPKIDDRALRQLTKQAVGGAAERMLLDELNKGINRLLQPR